MKISISITSVIDDICADSAIRAIFNRRDTVPPLLTGDHCEALGRVVVTAAAMTAGRLAARLTKFAVSEADGTIGFEVADTTRVRPEALRHCLETAVKFAAMYLVAVPAGDTAAADNYLRCHNLTLDSAATALDSRPAITLRPHYC